MDALSSHVWLEGISLFGVGCVRRGTHTGMPWRAAEPLYLATPAWLVHMSSSTVTLAQHESHDSIGCSNQQPTKQDVTRGYGGVCTQLRLKRT